MNFLNSLFGLKAPARHFVISCALFLTGLIAVSCCSEQARAAWGSTLSDGCGTNCASPQAVCAYWGQFYGGGCLSIDGLQYGVTGKPVGVNFTVGYLKIENVNATAYPYCNSPYVNDVLSPSGCSQAIYAQYLKQLGTPHESTGYCTAGNPIGINNGNKFQEVTDFETVGPDVLAFKRYYNSMSRRTASLGVNWRSNFDRSLSISGSAATTTSIQVNRPDGAVYAFSKNTSTNVWSTDKDISGALTTDGATVWTYTDANDTVEAYAFSTGKLNSITDRSGYTQTLAYDSNGNLHTVTDSFGRTLTFSFANGVLQSVTDPGGLVYSYGYQFAAFAGLYLLNSVAYPATGTSQTIQYLYENSTYLFALTGLVDESGNRYGTWSYNANMQAVSSAHGNEGADQVSLSYSLNASGYGTINVTNPLGKVLSYTTSFNTDAAKVTGVNEQASANTPAATISASYDSNGYLSSRTDENGNVTKYTNESRGLPTSIVRGSGSSSASTTSITWHSTLHVPVQVVEPGRTTTYAWNANGQLTSKTITDTTTQTAPYSTAGQTRTWIYAYSGVHLASVTDPVGSVVSYTYDANGYVQTVTNEMGLVTTVNATNGLGQPTQITDPNGVVTALAYDARGRLTSVSVDTANMPATSALAYDAVGDVTSVTDPNGATTTFTYDSARRLITTANALGETINYTRDAMGNVTSKTYASAGNATAYSKSAVFDELGRLIRQMGATPANSTYQYGYDRASNLVSLTDPSSNVFSQGYDALNRLISQTNEENATVHLTRSGVDDITAYQDARSLTTTYVRNGFGEVIQEQSPDRGVTTYMRDARGLVTQKTDPRGVVSNYQYDAQGRLTGKTFPASSNYWQGFDWDVRNNGNNVGLGNLVGVYNESGLNWRVFDTKGRIIVDWRTNNPASALAVAYNYDLAGNVTSMTYPSGRIVTFTRDQLGRIAAVATQQNSAAAIQYVLGNATYLPFGPLSGFTHGNGLATALTYDTDYRLTRVQVGPGNPSATLDRSLSWTGDDVINAIIDNQNPGTGQPTVYTAQTQTFTYTPARRLASASGYYGPLSWTYDANGNRRSETNSGAVSTYAYPSTANALSSVTLGGAARAFVYDAAGNVLHRQPLWRARHDLPI